MGIIPADHTTGDDATEQRGAVLVIVLVVMLVGVSLTYYVSGAAKGAVQSASLLEAKLKAKLEAESQLEKIRYLLSTNPFLSSRVKLIDRAFDPALPESLSLLGEQMHWQQSDISLRDTASMLNVPWSNPELVQRFLLARGISFDKAAHAADSWRDWLDTDDFRHLNGAERFDYWQLGIHAWIPRDNMALQAKEEAGLIAGLQQPELWDQIAQELVWTMRRGSNINTASEAMLQALLDIPPEQASQLYLRRQEMGKLTPQDLLQITGKKVDLTDHGLSEFPNYTVAVQIRTRVGEAREQVSAVLDFQPREDFPVTLMRYEQ